MAYRVSKDIVINVILTTSSGDVFWAGFMHKFSNYIAPYYNALSALKFCVSEAVLLSKNLTDHVTQFTELSHPATLSLQQAPGSRHSVKKTVALTVDNNS